MTPAQANLSCSCSPPEILDCLEHSNSKPETPSAAGSCSDFVALGLHSVVLRKLIETFQYTFVESATTGPLQPVQTETTINGGEIKMKVKEVMTKNPVCAVPTTSIASIAKMMKDFDCGSIPIVENFESMIPVGVVTDRDIVVRTIAKGIDPMSSTAMEIMSSPLVTVTPEMDLGRCIMLMEDKQVRRVPVVDHVGRCCGLVATADVAKYGTREELGEVLQEVSHPAGAVIWA